MHNPSRAICCLHAMEQPLGATVCMGPMHKLVPQAVTQDRRRLQHAALFLTPHTCTLAGVRGAPAIFGFPPGMVWAAAVLGFCNSEYSLKGIPGPCCSAGRSAAILDMSYDESVLSAAI